MESALHIACLVLLKLSAMFFKFIKSALHSCSIYLKDMCNSIIIPNLEASV